MVRYEIVIHGNETESYFVIKCRNRAHAIELYRLLKKSQFELTSDIGLGQEETEAFSDDIAIHGFGRLFDRDNAWIRLGINWPNSRRIEFTNPECGFEYVDSIKL